MTDTSIRTHTDHVALVSGANHGIGAATAQALAGRGAAVVVTYLRVHDEPDPALPATYAINRAGGADAVVAAIRAAGGRAHAIEADLSHPAVVPVLFDAAEKEFGPVDILVNNASGWVQDTFKPSDTDSFGRRMQPVTAATFGQQFAVDAMAAALLIAEFARRHVDRAGRWGRIIGLTSGGQYGFPNEVSYGAAKAAQENYTMSAAAELAPYGITANIVYPPVTDTGWVNDEVRKGVEASSEHTHVARPEQVADVIAFLTSDDADLVSGSIIRLR